MALFEKNTYDEIKNVFGNKPEEFFGYFYILEYGDLIKIGYTNNPYKRFISLRRQAEKYGNISIGRYWVSKKHTNYRNNETYLHHYFESSRISGTELFELNFDYVIEKINNIKIEYLDESKLLSDKSECFINGLKQFICGSNSINGGIMNNVISEKYDTINFYNDTFTAIKDNNGEIWAAINEILRNIGFDEKKIDNQRTSWNNDIVISKGSKILVLPTNGGKQNIYCLNRKYIPLALAKISITPTMQRDQPDLVNKLVRYQEECADALYSHFYKTNSVSLNKSTNLPLSREEMAMYITVLQATSDEIKNSCLETMSVLKESLNKQHDEFMSILNSFHDSSEKFFSSFNGINTLTTANKSNDDGLFVNEAKVCIEKICERLNVSVQAAYKLVYTNMSEIDGINVYKNKKESSAIKYVAKNEDYRKSFMKCAESLYNLPTFSNEKINTVSKFEDWKTYQKIPAEVYNLVEEYRNKKNKNSHDYARACLFKDFAKAIGINQKQLREKTVEYAKSIGIESCGIGYMIFNNKNMFEILKKIVAEA